MERACKSLEKYHDIVVHTKKQLAGIRVNLMTVNNTL